MQPYRASSVLTLSAAAIGTALLGSPAHAGGVGDFLSPAFGTDCENHHTTPYATGTTTAGTGAAGGNLLGLPLGSPLNQCGGADAPGLLNLHDTGVGVLGTSNIQEADTDINNVYVAGKG
ncbi:hypothetical protein ACN24M_01215 [Streptomyces microflavus]|uniref:hypothetical protein n=1 Tax=Streptomyces microflavus TaxID=1919 RepID=UPI003B211052